MRVCVCARVCIDIGALLYVNHYINFFAQKLEIHKRQGLV